tara:strand:+ start:755 stop:985 length:231 start_codon:yes stop_codon:yes gene_type:complete
MVNVDIFYVRFWLDPKRTKKNQKGQGLQEKNDLLFGCPKFERVISSILRSFPFSLRPAFDPSIYFLECQFQSTKML